MKAGRILFAICALGAAASAVAVDYPEERGAVPSVIPPSPDEAGIVRNPPRWRDAVAPQDQASINAYFARYDVNRDGVVSWDEAQADPELVSVFTRADADGNGVLTPAEFQTAAVLAANERAARRG
jgi:hypothetical protein